MNIARWFVFLQKHGDKKLSDVTTELLTDFMEGCGFTFPIHEATLNAVVAMCQGRDINTVADIARDPAAITQIIQILKKGLQQTQREFDEAVDMLTVDELLAMEEKPLTDKEV